MRSFQRFILLSFTFLFIICGLSGCQYTVLNPQGLIAAEEIHILKIAVLLMLIVVLPVIFMTLYFAWRYRENNTQATYLPNWAHSTLIEIICWAIPCLIILALGWITWVSAHTLDPYRRIPAQQKPLVIQAIAYEWKWLFIYPEQHIATVNFVQFPVNVPVEFLITADGPMNSLLIPQLAGQIYAMAGMKTQLHLIASHPGDYQGISANFSGQGFADMKFTARASSSSAFTQWVKKIQHSSDKLSPAVYAQFIQPSEKNPVRFFSGVNKNLFETVLMAPMMPMPPATDKGEKK